MRKGRWDNIKYRCDDWGDWVHKSVDGLSLPSTTTLARMIEMNSCKDGKKVKLKGNSPAWSNATETRTTHIKTPNVIISPRNSETDRAINDLGEPRWIKLIEFRHAYKATDRELQAILHRSQKSVANDFANIYAFLTGRLGENIRF